MLEMLNGADGGPLFSDSSEREARLEEHLLVFVTALREFKADGWAYRDIVEALFVDRSKLSFGDLTLGLDVGIINRVVDKVLKKTGLDKVEADSLVRTQVLIARRAVACCIRRITDIRP